MDNLQADTNKRKIQQFISGIWWQIIVLIVVVYATVYDNYIAKLILSYGYGPILALGLISYIIIVFRPIEKLVTDNLGKMKDSLTPTMTVLRFIGSFISILEISLLATHAFYFLAVIWMVTEICQYVAVRHAEKAFALKEAKPKPRMAEKELAFKLTMIQEKLHKINDSLDSIEDNESDEYKKLLAARHVILTELIEVLIKIALTK